MDPSEANIQEVVPELTADVGVKRGEKGDYAIMRDGEVQIHIECKKSTEALRIEHASQLFRYFAVTNTRIAVLTNGEVYRLYTDLDAPNRMDDKPFLVLDLLVALRTFGGVEDVAARPGMLLHDEEPPVRPHGPAAVCPVQVVTDLLRRSVRAAAHLCSDTDTGTPIHQLTLRMPAVSPPSAMNSAPVE